MEEQFLGVRLAAIAEHELASRAGPAAEQALRRVLQAVVHAGHGPRGAAAIDERGVLAATAAKAPGPARVRTHLAPRHDQAGQTLEHFTWHAGDTARKAHVV